MTFLLLFLVALVGIVVYIFATANTIKTINPSPNNLHVVDNMIDYRYLYPTSYWSDYTPWSPFGYRMPYFYRVGGSPYRYRSGGRTWGKQHGRK